MAISYPLSLPSHPAPTRITLSVITNVATARGVYTFQSQRQRHPGQIWTADVTLPRMERVDAEPWNAFLLALNGPEGSFLLGDPTGITPRGSAAGAPIVNGANQTGATLSTGGWSPNQTGVLKAGDYIQLGTRLHKVLVDADADGSGIAVLDLWPSLRSSPANGETVITENAKGVFQLVSNQVQIFSAQADRLMDVAFSAVEVL